MKTNRKLSTAKLVARFDNELKILLMNDLKSVKAKNAQLLSNAA